MDWKSVSEDFEPSPTLAVLESLTESLPKFPEALRKLDGCKEYKIEGAEGSCLTWKLFENPDVSVYRGFLSAGMLFPEHDHNEKEWIIVFSGSMNMVVEGRDHKLLAGDSITIHPHLAHKVFAYEDCRYIALTVPETQDF